MAKETETPEVVLGMAVMAELTEAGGRGAVALMHGASRAGIVALARIGDRLASDAEMRAASRAAVRLWREGPLSSTPQFAVTMARLARAVEK